MSSKPRVLVTRRVFPEAIEALATRYEVVSNQEDDEWSRADLLERAAGCDALMVVAGDRVDAELLAACPRLRVVATASVGYNHIDLAACTARDVRVSNTPDVLTESTADMAWALLMAAARRLSESERWLRAGHWKRWAFEQFLGAELNRSTLGIVGMGRIGSAVARRARGFEMEVVYHNRSAARNEATLGARRLDLDELLGVADHVVLVLPYSAESHHLIDARRLALMKPGATLVNIARGGIVDDAALVEALKTGRPGAAGLDVYENEPALHPGLLELPNVVLTPHIGSSTRATRLGMAMMAVDNLLAHADGEILPTALN